MDTGSLFLLLGLGILVALYISRPFFIRSSPSISKDELKLSVLLTEQERLINALQELDFDHAMAKIPDDDYQSQRASLLGEAVNVLRNIDTLQAVKGKNAESRIETAVATRRADAQTPIKHPRKRARPSAAIPDDELEALIAARRRERSEKAAGFCPQCGKPIQLSDHFCPRCGTAITAEANTKT